MPDQDVNVDTLAELAAMVDKTLAVQAAQAK
jgi:acyl carrier protein